MTMLDRLLRWVRWRVLDTTPDQGVAFFINNAAGVSWSVGDERLTCVLSGTTYTYDLSAFTITALAAKMAQDGFQISEIKSEFAALSACVLTEGSGNTLTANRLFAWRDILRAVFGAYARELRVAKKSIPLAVDQMAVPTAEGEWLQFHGDIYGVAKTSQAMTDAAYRLLIPAEAFRLRVNARAIEQAVLDITGKDITIKEPMANLFFLDKSALSGSAKFYDGTSIGPFLIQPVSATPIDWTDVLEVINRNKASGVLVLPPEEQLISFISGGINGTVFSQHIELRNATNARVDFNRLSDDLYLDVNKILKSPDMMATVMPLGSAINAAVVGYIDAKHYPIQDRSSSAVNTLIPHVDSAAMSRHDATIYTYPLGSLTWAQAALWTANVTGTMTYAPGINSAHESIPA